MSRGPEDPEQCLDMANDKKQSSEAAAREIRHNVVRTTEDLGSPLCYSGIRLGGAVHVENDLIACRSRRLVGRVIRFARIRHGRSGHV